MAEIDLRFIGTGNAFAPEGLCWNGFLFNGRYLFEAPPHALQALNARQIDADSIDAVILSHHHGDHFLGLPFLLLQWKYSGRTRPIRIVGPAGTRELATSIGMTVYPGLFDGPLEIEWDELSAGDGTTIGKLKLEALEMKHDERLSGSLGFRAHLGDRRLAYTGDSAMCEAVLDLARHSEVLVSECASRGEDIDVHMNLTSDMPLVRAAMKPDSTLVLTHLGPGIDDGGLRNTIVAGEGKSYRF